MPHDPSNPPTREPVESVLMDELERQLVDAGTPANRSRNMIPVIFVATLPVVGGDPVAAHVDFGGTSWEPQYHGSGAVVVNLDGGGGWDHGEFTPVVMVLDELLTTWLDGVDLEDEYQFLALEARVMDWLQAQADALIDHGQRALNDRVGYERTEVP